MGHTLHLLEGVIVELRDGVLQKQPTLCGDKTSNEKMKDNIN